MFRSTIRTSDGTLRRVMVSRHLIIRQSNYNHTNIFILHIGSQSPQHLEELNEIGKFLQDNVGT